MIVGINFIYQNELFAQPTLKVSGIVTKKEPFAIVNGKVVKEGDEINGVKVIEILGNSVKFKYKDMTFRKKIGEGEGIESKNTPSPKDIKIKDKIKENNRIIYNYPIVKVTEASKVVLKMFYRFEKFDGYLIFYNKKGEQCAVEPLSNPTYRYQVPWIKGIAADKVFVEKKLDITPNKFRYLTLKSGDIILAYPVELFVKGRFHGGHKVYFKFEWLNLQSSDECLVDLY